MKKRMAVFSIVSWCLVTATVLTGLLKLGAVAFWIVGTLTWLAVSLFSFFGLMMWKSLERNSDQDALTGLYNKRFLQTVLSDWGRHGEPFGVLMVDMDHFKEVNDTHGHLAGDAVLRRLAITLQRTVRRGDLLFRYGGEEFVVLLPNVSTVMEAEKIAQRIRKAVEFTAFPYVLHKTCSIGCTLFRQGDLADDVLSFADEALYQAKERGRNCVVVHER